MSYFPSISQNVTVDTANSESGATILNYSGATDIWNYAGVGTSTVGVNAIQIIVTSTKNLTIYVDQGNADNAFQLTDTYEYLTTKQFGITVQAVGAFVRVRAKNTSGASATATIDTVLCPIVEALPRSLDSRGDLRVAVKSLEDGYGFEVENTPQGDMRVISPVRLAGASFEGSIVDPNFWSVINTSGGTTTQAGGKINLATNTTANGATTFYSVRKARYVIGNANNCRIQGRLGDTGTINNTRRWGAALGANYTLTISSVTIVEGDIYTDISGNQITILISGTVTTATVYSTGSPVAGARTYTRVSGTGPATLTGSAFAIASIITDGYYFQISGTTFSVVTSIGGTATPINSGNFNGDIGATYAPTTSVTTYEIYYNTKTVWFVIDGKVLHSVTNSLTPLSNSQTLHVFLSNTNSGGSVTNVTMHTRSASIRRLGLISTESTSKYITLATTTILKYGPGRLKSVSVLNTNLNATTFTIYDALSASGTPIASISIPKNAAIAPFTLTFDLPFHNGLTVVNANDVQATIVYE
jgi:hypothetical protein